VIKRFFSRPDAVQWLSEESQSPITEMDLVREAAAGRLPVCFHYRGHLAVYQIPQEESVPVWWPRLSRHYFDGYLRSKTPVQLNTRRDNTRMRSGPDGKLLVSGSTTYEDRLFPLEVEVVELIWADPPLPALGPDQALGRSGPMPGGYLSMSEVPRDAWLFYAADLRALDAANPPNAETEPGTPAASGDAGTADPASDAAANGGAPLLTTNGPNSKKDMNAYIAHRASEIYRAGC
jgi:hypothetical protein